MRTIDTTLVHAAAVVLVSLCGLRTAAAGIRYDRPADYAIVTEQTRLAPAFARQMNDYFAGTRDELAKVRRAFEWVMDTDNLTRQSGTGGRLVGKRSAQQIIDEGSLTGCNDWGTVLTALLHNQGIPVVYANAAGIEWARAYRPSQTAPASGHTFLEVHVRGRWIVVDSVTGQYLWDYDPTDSVIAIPKPGAGQSGYFVYQKGKSLWDLGVRDVSQNIAQMVAFATGYPLHTIELPEVKLSRLVPARSSSSPGRSPVGRRPSGAASSETSASSGQGGRGQSTTGTRSSGRRTPRRRPRPRRR